MSRLTRARRLGLLVIAVLVALGGRLAMASTASAHNVLRSTSPADASTVDRVPAEVVLTFDEPALAMGTAMIVTGPAGQVQTGPARLVDNTVAQSIGPDAPAGTYTVQWRVTSADGHPISGTFGFIAEKAGGGSAAPTDRPEQRYVLAGLDPVGACPRGARLAVAGDRRHAAAVRLASTLIARRRPPSLSRAPSVAVAARRHAESPRQDGAECPVPSQDPVSAV